MVKLKKRLWLSLFLSVSLLFLTYGAEGWMYASWISRLLDSSHILPQFTKATNLGIFYGLAVAGILLVVLSFTSPLSLITIGLDNWLKSDSRAFFSIFIGAFAFAIIVQRVDYFARFLVLLAAVFLSKLDLQLIGFSRWLCSLILAFLCWLGFTGGILAFYGWHF